MQSLLLQTQPVGDLEELEQSLNLLLGEILYNSGCIATETNKPNAALSHFEKFNLMMLKQLGPDSTDNRLAISWNELGNGLMMNKQWEDAIDCFNKSIETLKKQPNFKKIQLSFPLVNLGFAYWILGQLDKAEEVCQQALMDRQAAFGIDDAESFMYAVSRLLPLPRRLNGRLTEAHSTGKLLHAFGNIRAAQRRMDESFDLHKRALVQYQKFTVGKNHHRTADVCIKVADHYVRVNQYQGARFVLCFSFHSLLYATCLQPAGISVCWWPRCKIR
jgi:tetratricopeptide (TPR) repeat protein